MPFTAAPCGYLAFDDERRIAAVNQGAVRYLGYQREELIGRDLELLLPRSVRMLFYTTVYPALADGRHAEEIYALLRRKDGEELPVLLNAARQVHGDTFQTECVFLAVTRRHSFERHLEQLEATRLATAEAVASPSVDPRRSEFIDRMSSLGVLLAGIMHEVRNPLTYVQGNLDLLTMGLDQHPSALLDREAVRRRIGEASYGVGRIVELVSAVGMVSRMEVAEPAPVDVSHVVDSAVRLVQHHVTPYARVEVDQQPPGPIVLAHEARLAQVVMNLLTNAAQALRASHRADGLIRVRTFTDDARAVITVADNGPGVPSALRDRIFDAFYTTKPVGEGTGLGLHISREIVSSLAGSLDLLSSSTAGATFGVTLPLMQAPAQGAG